jgi:hypothetical protein
MEQYVVSISLVVCIVGIISAMIALFTITDTRMSAAIKDGNEKFAKMDDRLLAAMKENRDALAASSKENREYIISSLQRMEDKFIAAMRELRDEVKESKKKIN